MPKGIYKRTKKHNENIRKALKGKPFSGIPFRFTGQKHTEETKKKLRKARKGKTPALGKRWKLSKEIVEKMKGRIGYWKGKKKEPMTIEQKEKISITKRGNKNPAWIDGRSKLTAQIRKCWKYKEWRKSIFERDDYTCKTCKIRGGYLEVDHYPKEFSQIFSENEIKTIDEALNCEELWDTNNGRTLCKKCHDKTKTYVNNKYRKSAKATH